MEKHTGKFNNNTVKSWIYTKNIEQKNCEFR